MQRFMGVPLEEEEEVNRFKEGILQCLWRMNMEAGFPARGCWEVRGYLELSQLLELAAQVTGAVLQASQVELQLQSADRRGLPHRATAGRGRPGYWRGPTAPATRATGCREGTTRMGERKRSPCELT